MKKVEFKKKVDGELQSLYPKTSAGVVEYNGRSVSDTLTEILNRLSVLEQSAVAYVATSTDTIDDGSTQNV